jgi:hypothetical protein
MKKVLNGSRIAVKIAQSTTAILSCVLVAGLTDSTKVVTLSLMLCIVYVTLVWDD